MAFRTTPVASTPRFLRWSRPARTWLCLTCAATARLGSLTSLRRDPASKPRWPTISSRLIESLGITIADRGWLRLGRPGGLPGRGAVAEDGVSGLVTVDGYNIQDIAAANTPARRRPRARCGTSTTCTANAAEPGSLPIVETSPACSGRSGHRRGTSPKPTSRRRPRRSTTATSSTSSCTPTDIALASYPGDPAYEATEMLIARQPTITVPTVVLDCADDGLGPPATPCATSTTLQ